MFVLHRDNIKNVALTFTKILRSRRRLSSSF